MADYRNIAMLIGAIALFHAALAGLVPLVEDEAYYALWASVPSAGYYDHPPMVAWGIAAGQWLFGKGTFGVRLLSVLSTALVLYLVFMMGRRIAEARTGLIAAGLTAVTLPVIGFGYAATPDPFSVLFWTAATAFVLEATLGERRNFWLAAGLCAGLGVLSKFTNLFFGVGILGWLILSREGRGHLAHWQVWGGAVLGLLVLVPFALWNIDNGWIGLERQFGRIGEAEGFSAARYLLFWLSFVILLTPLIFIRFIRSLWLPRVPRVLLWLIAPILIYLTWHATKASAGGQWLVPIFPTLALMAALVAGRARWAIGSGLALSVSILIIGFWPNRVLIGGHHPFTQTRGWEGVNDEIALVIEATGAKWIATDAYGLTGQLAWYQPKGLEVWALSDLKRYGFRGERPKALCEMPALFISRTNFWNGVPYFVQQQPLEPIIRKDKAGRVLMTYYLALGTGC